MIISSMQQKSQQWKHSQRPKSSIGNITLIGYSGDPKFHQYKELTATYNRIFRGKLNISVQEQHYEADYDIFFKNCKRQCNNFLPALKEQKQKNQKEKKQIRPPYFLINDDLPVYNIQDMSKSLTKLAGYKPFEFQYDDFFISRPMNEYRPQTVQHLTRLYTETEEKCYVQLEIQQGKGVPFIVVIELLKHMAPKTCNNFLSICEGFYTDKNKVMHYKNTNLHRIKKNAFIQGGILSNFDKQTINGPQSIYGDYFEDECHVLKHDRPGIVGMTNKGIPHTNGTQFYITLGKSHAFDSQMVAFGRVVQGLKDLEKLNKIKTVNQMPCEPIFIKDCGKFYYGGKPKSAPAMLNNGRRTSIQKPDQNLPAHQLAHQKEQLEAKIFRKELFSSREQVKTLTDLHRQILCQPPDVLTDKEKLVVVFNCLKQIFCEIRVLIQNHWRYQDWDSFMEKAESIFTEYMQKCDEIVLFFSTTSQQVTNGTSNGKFLVVYTPLDISKMYDIQNCGSTFCIYKKSSTTFRKVTKQDLLLGGEQIAAAGYCMYGQCLQLVYCAGFRVNGFTFDEESGDFILTHPKMKHTKKSGIIAIDESQFEDFDQNTKVYILRKKKQPQRYYSRYSGSIVSDFHRMLLFGGICMYPLHNTDEQRMINVFDGMVFSHLIDQAWEKHTQGQQGSFLMKKPQSTHTRLSFFCGCGPEIAEIENLYLSIKRANSILNDLNENYIKV